MNNSEQMAVPNVVPDKAPEGNNEKIDRREWLKRFGKGALALWAANMIGGCMPENNESSEKPFNKEYSDLEQEFIKEGFSDSEVLREFRATYGKEAFEEFKEKYNLSDEEAQDRWSKSISRHRGTLLDRARNWEKVKKVAKENGIEIDERFSYEMVDGQVESINGKSIPKKSNESATDDKKSTSLESIKIDTSAY